MRKIIVAGPRDFNNYDLLVATLTEYLAGADPQTVEIVSGTAKGADKLGEQFALEYGCQLKRMPAQWDKYGKSAGYRRNVDMADYAGECVAFWNGKSRGTGHMIDIAKTKKIELKVVMYED